MAFSQLVSQAYTKRWMKFFTRFTILQLEFGVSCVKIYDGSRTCPKSEKEGQGLESNFMDYWTGWHCI